MNKSNFFKKTILCCLTGSFFLCSLLSPVLGFGFSIQHSSSWPAYAALPHLPNANGSLDVVNAPESTYRSGRIKIKVNHDGTPDFFLPDEPNEGGCFDNQFYTVSPYGWVTAVIKKGADLYVAGTYKVTGKSEKSVLAKWDGTKWTDLNFFNDESSLPTIYDMIFIGENLYVAGSFTTLAGEVVNNIAMWDGNHWSNLDGGVTGGFGTGTGTGSISTLAVIGSDLYVGGTFSKAGEGTAMGVAKWDGAEWSELDGGVNKEVQILKSSGTDLYVGGSFTKAGNKTSNCLAKWDGTQWITFGEDIAGNYFTEPYIGAIEIYNDELYVGGGFRSVGGIAAESLAMYKNGSWSAVENISGGFTKDLVVIGDYLYASGLGSYQYYNEDGEYQSISFARFDLKNRDWSPALEKIGSSLPDLTLSENELYVYANGPFISENRTVHESLITIDGTDWESAIPETGKGVWGTVNALATYDSKLILAGSITKAGNLGANNIVQWNGTEWEAFGEGVNGQINALQVRGDYLFIGGEFTVNGNPDIHNLARWDGHNWYMVAEDVFPVNTMMVDEDGALFVAGEGLAKLSGSTWRPFDAEISGDIYGLAKVNNNLYLGGNFSSIDGNRELNYIVKWSNSKWTSLSRNLGPGRKIVTSIVIKNKEVWIAGEFYMGNVARLVGTQWEFHTVPFQSDVYTRSEPRIKLINGKLFAFGRSLSDNAYSSIFIQRDIDNWIPIAEGADATSATSEVNDILLNENNLYAAGSFNMAGGMPARNFAVYTCADAEITSITASSQSSCDPVTNKYGQELIVTYENVALTGELQVNGQTFPVLGSPQTIVLENLEADGNPVSVQAFISDFPLAFLNIQNLFVAPANCYAPEEEVKITANDGGYSDRFGYATAISDDKIIVGAYANRNTTNRTGAAYIYTKETGGWIQQAKLTASDGNPADRFGRTVDIAGNYAIVGAPLADAAGDDSGAAYIYYYNGNAWVEQQKLIPADAAAKDRFGFSVGISGDWAIVGAPYADSHLTNIGYAYLFHREGTSWVEYKRFLNEEINQIIRTGDKFGWAVDIEGENALVSAYGYDNHYFGIEDIGEVFLLHLENNDWKVKTVFRSPKEEPKIRYGTAVAIDSNRVVIGSIKEDNEEGVAYLYEGNDRNWSLKSVLKASDAATEDHFGSGVAISDNKVIVSASNDDNEKGKNAGALYVFELDENASATEVNKILATDGGNGDRLGFSIATNGTYLVAGANGDDDAAMNAGAAYIYDITYAKFTVARIKEKNLKKISDPDEEFVNVLSAEQVKIFPNPVFDQLNIKMTSTIAELLEIELSDQLGRTIFTRQTQVEAGDNTLVIDLLEQQVPESGVFYLEIKTNHGLSNTFRLLRE